MDRARSTRCCEAGNLALNVQLLDHGSRPLDSQPATLKRAMCSFSIMDRARSIRSQRKNGDTQATKPAGTA